jgi:hypothetical protein
VNQLGSAVIGTLSWSFSSEFSSASSSGSMPELSKMIGVQSTARRDELLDPLSVNGKTELTEVNAATGLKIAEQVVGINVSVKLEETRGAEVLRERAN